VAELPKEALDTLTEAFRDAYKKINDETFSKGLRSILTRIKTLSRRR